MTINYNYLNVNELNSWNKRHEVDEWIKKKDPSMCCLHKAHFSVRTHTGLKWKDQYRYSVQMENRSKLEYVYSSDKIDWKTMKVLRDKETHTLKSNSS